MSYTSHSTVSCNIRPAKPVTFLARLRHAVTLSRQRRALAALDDHQLRDIGVTREQAVQESIETAWDAPSTWHY